MPVLSKILEKAVHQQLMEYLETNNLLSDLQFGYRRKRSTDLATVLLADSIRRAGDEGKLTGAVFLDLSKAFDTLGHDRLILKLKSYGVEGMALKWFTEYLFHRKLVVKIGQELSTPSSLECGVPQGSILGPLLFLIYFNDLGDCLLNCNLLQYADDTVIYVSSKNITDIENRLNEDMTAINHYRETNEHIINLKKGKTECVLFGTAKRISTFEVKN